MSKKAMLSACDAALAATDAANKKNTSESHSNAASLHRIASETAKLNGENAISEKHKDLAVQHDLCASRCQASETHLVKVPEMTSQEIAARKAFQAVPDSIVCAHCGHEFEAKAFEQGESGTATCPDCKKETKVEARSGKSDSAEHDDLEVKCGSCGKEFDATEDKNYGSGTVTCPGCDNSVQVSTSKVANEAKKAGDKAALEAGGSSEGTLKGHATKKTAAAEDCSLTAEDASKKADASGLVSDHKAACEAHDAAAAAHMAAMKAHVKADSSDDVIEKHHAAAVAHKAMAAKHAPIQADDAGDDSMTAKVHRALESLKASGANPSLRDVRSVMWREHKISLGEEDVALELATPLKVK